MGISTLRVRANCDQVLIAWKTDAFIKDCRGFALARECQKPDGTKTSDFVQSWVGFKGQPHAVGEHEPTETWPIQRYNWADLLVNAGDKLRYRVIPMLRNGVGTLTRAPNTQWSKWSNWVTVATGGTPGIDAYFNRGIVPGQFIARQNLTKFKNGLDGDIKKPGSANRNFLSGALRPALLKRLADAAKGGGHIFAALYELNDPELLSALLAFGKKCHLILANGAFKSKSDDENKDARGKLRGNVDLHNRMVSSPHFAHNKFVVFCDGLEKPQAVWTGSTNWTVTGLCTQVNNGICVESPTLATAYKTRWDELEAASNGYPATLTQSGSTPATANLGTASLKAWNVPCTKTVDLNDARQYLLKAKQGVLFLMFNPGPKGTLLNDIMGLDPSKLLIHGVVNQDPGGNKAPVLQLTERGKNLPKVALSAVLPTALQNLSSRWFIKENRFAMVMIHSKVIVVDPFGANPVVMTGSHNMGPKASGKNDDNLLIIEHAPAVAAEYAVNIAFVFAHYKWRYNQWLKVKAAQSNAGAKVAKSASPNFDGINDDDQWQHWYDAPARLLETDFWGG